MARGETQTTVTALVAQILGAEFETTPDWLLRPGKLECSNHWPLVKSIYKDITGLEFPTTMPPHRSAGRGAVRC